MELRAIWYRWMMIYQLHFSEFKRDLWRSANLFGIALKYYHRLYSKFGIYQYGSHLFRFRLDRQSRKKNDDPMWFCPICIFFSRLLLLNLRWMWRRDFLRLYFKAMHLLWIRKILWEFFENLHEPLPWRKLGRQLASRSLRCNLLSWKICWKFNTPLRKILHYWICWYFGNL